MTILTKCLCNVLKLSSRLNQSRIHHCASQLFLPYTIIPGLQTTLNIINIHNIYNIINIYNFSMSQEMSCLCYKPQHSILLYKKDEALCDLWGPTWFFPPFLLTLPPTTNRPFTYGSAATYIPWHFLKFLGMFQPQDIFYMMLPLPWKLLTCLMPFTFSSLLSNNHLLSKVFLKCHT